MPKGGARNRSGPGADPQSLRSADRGLVLTALPSEGYPDEAPKFPLPTCSDREFELWAWAWSTPQACAWALEPWRWQTVAMWVRTFVICEGTEATAADKGSLHRFADQIGLTPAGLKENGWAIARDETAARRDSKPATKATTRDRFKVVDGSAG
jgi:hypothetical protein